MHGVHLDASRWASSLDFFDDFLPLVGAPGWHGRNLDAMWDGMTGDLRDVKPPITHEIASCQGSALVRDGFLDRPADLFAQARAEGFDYTLVLR